MRAQILLFILILQISAFAQKEANIWYFGKYGGLDFSKGEVEVITNGRLSTTEGVASICDSAGNLLFYTDGVTVWNKNHKMILNGYALKGHPSSTQSGVIIPMPDNDSLYYLFTISYEGNPDGFCYSIVNIKGDEGRGEVIMKNIPLASPVTEKITGIRHRNKKDYWILTHKWNSDEFLVYKLTKSGLESNFQTIKIGSNHGGDINNSIGYMKASTDGTQLAVAIKNSDLVELFDFDDSTGTISNPLSIVLPENSLPYGIEFSPNGSNLYISTGSTQNVYQFNLQKTSTDSILQSATIVGHANNWLGALQLGIDQKIYVAGFKAEYLDVIEYPDSVGISCAYQKEKIFLQGNLSNLGFPTFLQNFFIKQVIDTTNILYFSSNQKIELGKPLILKNILFETDKATLLPKSFIELNKLVEVLKKNPSYHIAINGHTDNVGNKAYNIRLSHDRANSVANYLMSKGISKDRISTNGYGNSVPIATNETPEGRQLNRRVEFILSQSLTGTSIVKSNVQ